jgi:hypothetical protein
MNTNDFHIDQLVDAADTSAVSRACATYTCKTTHGFIVAIDARHITVEWIDSWGPQHETYPLEPELLRAATLTAAAQSRTLRQPNTRAQTNLALTDPSRNEPSIEIRELKIWATGTREGPTGLRFHTVEDANTALEAIAAAQAVPPTRGPDLASVIPGAHIVAVYWAMHTAVYRLDRIHPAYQSRAARPAVLAG